MTNATNHNGDEPAILADGWQVRYPDQTQLALQSLSFRIGPGEKVLLLGPSGSGKSTLVNSLIGLVPHSTYAYIGGDLRVLGKSARTEGPGELARHAGVVFQDPDSQLTMLSVSDEIAFGLENLGLPPKQMADRIERALAEMGLSAHHQTAVDHLSGGMKQRLVIAALLAMQPEVLVLDEPTSQLDPVGAQNLINLLQQLCDQRPQMTLIVVEHRIDTLMPLVERVMVLDQAGQLAFDCTPDQAFGEHAEQLAALNVWLPTVADARLARQAGTFDAWCATSTRNHATTKAPVLQFDRVSFRHDDTRELLDAVDFALHRGDICALVGRNGSGKTTLAQLAAGMIAPDQGKVTLQGHPVQRLPAQTLARQLGYVFQNPEHQFVTDRVLDEVRFNRHHLSDETDEDAWQVLRALRLDHYAQRNPFTLSHGQKRRLSAATMLVSPRDLIIMDEPTFGQDPSAQLELRGLLESMAASGTAILLITHDMDLVWRTANRVVGLYQGQLEGDLTPTAFFADSERLQRLGLRAPAITRHLEAWSNAS